jgi:hypothetical protein
LLNVLGYDILLWRLASVVLNWIAPDIDLLFDQIRLQRIRRLRVPHALEVQAIGTLASPGKGKGSENLRDNGDYPEW